MREYPCGYFQQLHNQVPLDKYTGHLLSLLDKKLWTCIWKLLRILDVYGQLWLTAKGRSKFNSARIWDFGDIHATSQLFSITKMFTAVSEQGNWTEKSPTSIKPKNYVISSPSKEKNYSTLTV